MRRAPKQTANAAQGQAMVEFVVAAVFFLLPLFLAIAVIGKYLDVQHTTTMAARYATWERTVWYDDSGTVFDHLNRSNQKSGTAIANEIAARIINDHSSALSIIKSADAAAVGFINGIDPLWRDHEHKPYLEGRDQQATTLAHGKAKTDIAGAAIAAIAALPLPAGVVGTLVPPVATDTLALTTVSLKRVSKSSLAYQRLWPRAVWAEPWNGSDFRAGGGILSNTWYANGSGSTKAMVAQSVPTAQGLGKAVGTLTAAIMLQWDPLMHRPELGKIDPDVVPPDRLTR